MKNTEDRKGKRRELFFKLIPFVLLIISAILLGIGVYYTLYNLGYEEAKALGTLEPLHGRSITFAVVTGTIFLAFWSIFYILVKKKKT